MFRQFGYCSFINYGMDYAGARDNYVYTVSHDNASGYHNADRFILMRVSGADITDSASYEFFQALDADGRSVWTTDMQNRGAVFTYPRRCLRSSVSYNAGIGRYFWCHTTVTYRDSTASEESLGIYDAPEPWGPWTTVLHTEKWDVKSGQMAAFPTKWMSADGRTMYLVFSSEQVLAVRRVDLSITPLH
jgi:hypothetical protein